MRNGARYQGRCPFPKSSVRKIWIGRLLLVGDVVCLALVKGKLPVAEEYVDLCSVGVEDSLSLLDTSFIG